MNNFKINVFKKNTKSDTFTFKKFNYYFWDFSPNVYKELYSDVRNLNGIELMKHYFYVGRFQRRIYNKGIKILIVCDPWKDEGQFTNGGNTALYNLGKLINEKNIGRIYAKMYVLSREHIQNPFCNYFAYDNEINARTLVIYPDGNYGNPLSANNVMRWILLEVGTTYRPIDIIKTWDKNDLVYHWEPSNISSNTKMLNNCVIDSSFINRNENRNNGSSCFLIRKRTFFEKNIIYIHPDDSVCLDKLSKDSIINYFNLCEKFYCYDLKTFYIIGAIICGCKVILVPDRKTKENYISKSVFNKFAKMNNFFAWGEDDIASIQYNNDDVQELINYINSLSNSINGFLIDIYNYFNSIPTNIPTVKSVYYKQN